METTDLEDELDDDTDPYNCSTCLEAGDSCDFHDGYAKGWDACAGFIASYLDDAPSDGVVA
jgi:hypothetical protein